MFLALSCAPQEGQVVEVEGAEQRTAQRVGERGAVTANGVGERVAVTANGPATIKSRTGVEVARGTDWRIADCWRWRGADCGLWAAEAKNAATIRLSKGRKVRERSERRKF